MTRAEGESGTGLVSARDGGSVIAVYTQPRASKNGIVGIHDGHLKVTIAAPPVEGKANALLCSFLAHQLRVAKRAVQVVGGKNGRRKVVFVAGLSPAQVSECLGT